MEGIIALLIPVIFILAVATTLGFAFYLKNKERMLMIEKGAAPPAVPINRYISWLKVGIVAVGIALGGILSNIVFSLNEAGVFIIILFGGIAMILADIIEKKQNSKETDD